jgi:hypothetical protein
MLQALSRFDLDHPPKGMHPNAVPRESPSDETESHGDKKWVRNFPRICPFCGVQFYGWAPDPWPHSWPQMAQETVQSLRLGEGHRNTCGHKDCHEAALVEYDTWESEEYKQIEARRREMAALARIDQEQEGGLY